MCLIFNLNNLIDATEQLIKRNNFDSKILSDIYFTLLPKILVGQVWRQILYEIWGKCYDDVK